MNKVQLISAQYIKKQTTETKKRHITLIEDIKALVKWNVLLANVLPVFTGFWLALYFSNAVFVEFTGVLLLTIIGSTFVMAGALVLNNWYDSDIDKVMARTQHRPTVTGSFSLRTVLVIGIAFTLIGFILLLFTTLESVIYAFVGWFVYVFLYTMWSKRRYTFNTIIGSVSGAVTPFIGWAAVEPGFHTVPFVLFLILFIWQMPHTFAIAMKKCNEYRDAGVAMLPVVRGFDVTKRQMVGYIASLLPLPFFLGDLGITFVVIATILNLGWLTVSIKSLFSKNDLKWANINFLYSVNLIAILFLLMVIVTLPVFN